MNTVYARVNPVPPSQRRNQLAQLQCDNQKCNYKVSELLLLIEGMSHTIADAVSTIEKHEHNDNALKILECDLTALLDVVNDKLLSL